jgi:hypothetical protein
MFTDHATLRFSEARGFGESYFILCPVCWNSSIKLTRWEDGSVDEEECAVCARRDRILSGQDR